MSVTQNFPGQILQLPAAVLLSIFIMEQNGRETVQRLLEISIANSTLPVLKAKRKSGRAQ